MLSMRFSAESNRKGIGVNMNASVETLLTGNEVAKTLRLPKSTIYDHARSGILPSVRIGRAVRFRPEDITEFVRNGGQSLAGGWRKEAENE